MPDPTENQSAPPQRAEKIPRYRVMEKAYIDDVLYEPREVRTPGQETQMQYPEISFRGIPGPHLVPVNAAAKAMCEKHKDRMTAQDPIRALSVIGAAPGSTSQ